jgi:hypothetical protein
LFVGADTNWNLLMEEKPAVTKGEYAQLRSAVVTLIGQGRRLAARSVNAALSSTYWLMR